jgi:hypothetical protein
MRSRSSVAVILALALAPACERSVDDDELIDSDAGLSGMSAQAATDGGLATMDAARPDAGPASASGSPSTGAPIDAGGATRTPETPGGGTIGKDGGAPSVVSVADAGMASAGDAGSPDTVVAGPCDWSEPPADVAKWVDESWKSQLGSNIKTRKAWNLDHVMLNRGQLNLCVRWGATSAVPEMMKANLASTIENWFNDWFRALGNYGCFPYGNGIKVKITGWAVRPGKEALLGQLDPSVPVYTETDAEGEPKCPDACSSFVHWDHQFPACKGGEANHSDYWLWFDDKLPGGGGAAAVGGDWGLRMPVSTFLGAFANKSFEICEHEMGHGFGFQDYYDWTGTKPKGGSLMIVGSSQSQSPTSGDTWLLRRTWKEMKALRGW